MTCNAVCHCYDGPLTIGRDCTIMDLGTSTALAFPYSLTQNFGFQGGSFESTIVEGQMLQILLMFFIASDHLISIFSIINQTSMR